MGFDDQLPDMSDAATTYFDELWQWLWHGPDGDRTIGDKRAELRAKYGEAAETEVIEQLRARGFLKEKPDAPCSEGQRLFHQSAPPAREAA